jgi:excisionase family DNA binding protein
MIGVSSMTVRRLVRAKKFPNAFKLDAKNSHWRIPEEDVKAYLQSIGRTIK